MAEEVQGKSDAVFRLPENCTVAAAESIHRGLIEALAETAALRVDCSAAAEADIGIVQLLIAARRSAAEAGKGLTLTGTSATLRPVLIAAGVLPERPELPVDGFWLGEEA